MMREQWLAEEPDVPPGDDVVPVPRPVDEEPPHDRFCDLVLTGGVASGVVYPWAIVEIARAFRFRNIGGTSVGAMAAALAAAAEYGRRTGVEKSFEPLRRAPASLAALQPDGRTRMLSLFQTNERGQRLIRLWGELGQGNRDRPPGWTRKLLCVLRVFRRPALIGALWDELRQGSKDRHPVWTRKLLCVLRVFRRPALIGALLGLVLALLLCLLVRPAGGIACITLFVVGLALVGLCAALALLWALWSDFRHGVIANEYGLCKGASTGFPAAGATGIVEWLHKGIQTSAGLDINTDPPLTFRDLWSAPAYPGAERRDCGSDDAEDRRSINLQMITTNVTHGRPYRLPLNDTTSRLFYCRKELEDYFPKCVLDALHACSRPYAPQGSPGSEPDVDHPTAAGLRELPGGELPIVVAARLSLSFPLLFSAVPLWAIDYEVPRKPRGDRGRDVRHNEQRVLRRCMFSDGGVSSNFPVHLFDAALPRRPTFGLWLDRRTPYEHLKTPELQEEEREIPDLDERGEPLPTQEQKVWLPDHPEHGRSDNWSRFDPLSKAPPDHALLTRGEKRKPPAKPGCRTDAGRMWGFMGAIATSATDWRDRTNFRLPHVRNRVARLLLKPGEGGLHIGMSREQILDMAHRYGTVAGRKFVDRFASDHGQPARAWKEQRWSRFNLLLNGLRERLEGLARSADWSAHTVPLNQAIDDAMKSRGPIRDGRPIKLAEAEALKNALRELEQLDGVLRDTPDVYKKKPVPEMRLRPPL